MHGRTLSLLVVLGMVLCLGAPADAAVLFTESFEAESVAEGTWGTETRSNTQGGVPGWTVTSDTMYHWYNECNPDTAGNVRFSSSSAPDGTNGLMIKSPAGAPGKTALYTTSPIGTIAASTSYALSVDVGRLLESSTFYKMDAVMIALTTNPGWSLDDPLTNEATNWFLGSELTQGAFVEKTVTLDAATIAAQGLAGKSLYVYLWIRGTDAKEMVVFDDIRVTTTLIPEPATMSLLVLGGVAALLRKRRN
ncbi:MAG: PEP-CTERM sorting domain-containing protein [Planctomycetaceae bacterium]|nr:PEP-CTERM sorting domain-containing protein [Planctomycetaceae bacterium]